MIQEPADRQARYLHDEAIVIDGHSDILIPISEGKMRLAERVEIPDDETWLAPPGLDNHPLVKFGANPHTAYFGCMGQYDLPRLKEGGLTAQVMAIYLDDDKLAHPLQAGLDLTWNLLREVEENDSFELITAASDIRRLKSEGKCGAILSLEGCEALAGDIRFLDLYYRLGLRIASLTHTRRNVFADGCFAADKPGGLTGLGKQLVKRMNALKIVVDLVHISETGFWEIMELTTDPVILSHSTPTMFPNSNPGARGPYSGKVPRPRLELPRDRRVLEAIAQKHGVLGITWVCHASLDDVIADIETALDVMGVDHIGLGSDLYGTESAPKGLEDISRVRELTSALVRRGHTEETIKKFLGANYLRVFESVWGS